MPAFFSGLLLDTSVVLKLAFGPGCGCHSCGNASRLAGGPYDAGGRAELRKSDAMTLSTLVGSSISTLLSQKQRSISTMISLAWAVASFLLLISYGRGFDAALQEAFYAVGQDIVLMSNGQTSEQAGGMRAGRNIYPFETDIEQIREAVPWVGGYFPGDDVHYDGGPRHSPEGIYDLGWCGRSMTAFEISIWYQDAGSMRMMILMPGGSLSWARRWQRRFSGNSPAEGEEILVNFGSVRGYRRAANKGAAGQLQPARQRVHLHPLPNLAAVSRHPLPARHYMEPDNTGRAGRSGPPGPDGHGRNPSFFADG